MTKGGSQTTLSKYSKVLRCAYKFGLFPCLPAENFVLQPLKVWQHLLKISGIFGFLGLLQFGAIWFFLDKATVEFNFLDYMGFFFKTSRSTLDGATFMCPVFMSIMLGAGLCWFSAFFAEPLANFEKFMKENMPLKFMTAKGHSLFWTIRASLL